MPVRRESWTLERVIAELQALHAGGESVHRTALLDAGRGKLVSAVERCCGTFARAHRLAGISLEPMRPTWTPERVISELQQLHREGGTTNSEELRKLGRGGLVHGGKKCFGSWHAALKAAGVPKSRRGAWRSWDEVADALRVAHAKGFVLSTTALCEQGMADLVAAARDLAGGWNKALAKAGVPLVMEYERWTREDVLAGILSLHVKGGAGYGIAIARGQRKLTKAAIRHFGSWTAACEAAIPGYQAPLVRWTVERLVSEISARYRAGKPMTSTIVQREQQALTAAAHRLGLTWREACRRARVPMAALRSKPPVRRIRWNEQLIVERLRLAADAGTPLLVRSFPPGFVQSAIRQFGSWPQAIAAAGLTRAYERNREAALANRLGGVFAKR